MLLLLACQVSVITCVSLFVCVFAVFISEFRHCRFYFVFVFVLCNVHLSFLLPLI
jgi:hypothetical protein